MEHPNLGLCNDCRARVPCEFFFRDGQVWIRKQCPDCGATESMVSSDAANWQAKRDLWQYVPNERVACHLHCENCKIPHKPNMVFLDVTNRCNMNCPICIATIRGMGFEFNPPMEYFEKIFASISQMDPTPMVELFGGEPTVRNDLVDIITTARKYGIRPRVVTNGIRLADEDYCRMLCENRVRVRFAFDGSNPDTYERLRHNRAACEKKLKGLENLDRFSRRRHAIIACAAHGVNDNDIPDLLQYCHDHRDFLSEIGIIPLTENWEEGEFDPGVKRTTLEDVEKMIQDSVPGGGVEFIPAGLSHAMRKPRSFFRKSSRSEILLLGGVHPNCESATLLISDGKTYRSINYVLRRSFTEMTAEYVEKMHRLGPKLDRLDPTKPFQRLRGKLVCIWTFGPWIIRRIRWPRLLTTFIKVGVGNRFRRPKRKGPAKHRRFAYLFRAAVLPFEEYHSIDAARMENCKAVFAYEDVLDGEVKTIPACTWYSYRNPLLEKLSEKYGVVKSTPAKEATADESVPVS